MEYIVLTQTDFFRQIDLADSHNELCPAYKDFTDRVIRLCISSANLHQVILALVYAENELQFHNRLHCPEEAGIPHLYIRKALAFVRKMQKHIVTPVPPLSPQSDNHHNNIPIPASAIRWTGKASDLIEILYGMVEMGCINDGEIQVGELAAFFYSLFKVEAKDCYRIYSDIKLRKNDSRTYFLDKMQEKLNKRMDMDEERERIRR